MGKEAKRLLGLAVEHHSGAMELCTKCTNLRFICFCCRPLSPILTVASVINGPSDVLDMPVDPNEPTYCLCHQVSYGEMIGCDNPDVSPCFILSIKFV